MTTLHSRSNTQVSGRSGTASRLTNEATQRSWIVTFVDNVIRFKLGNRWNKTWRRGKSREMKVRH